MASRMLKTIVLTSALWQSECPAQIYFPVSSIPYTLEFGIRVWYITLAMVDCGEQSAGPLRAQICKAEMF